MMKAIVTISHGEYEMLKYKNICIPELNKDEVLIKVLSCGVNNTDINTRIGWYDEGWQGITPFPLIQGTDCCGIVVKVNNDCDSYLLNKRVLIRPCQRTEGFSSFKSKWFGSDYNGAFAEYTKVPSSEVFIINSNWTDIELASIPCAYGTSENMLIRSNVCKGDKVIIVGASGGVGSATVQLSLRRGADITAITNANKVENLINLGCNKVFSREDNLLDILGENYADIIIDNVGGELFPIWLKLLKIGGKYVTSGAIAGAITSLDMRDLYLKDLTLIGSTCWDEIVFPNIISYIEKNEIKPLIYKSFPLEQIVDAQKEFLKKNHIGKIVLYL